LPRHCVLLIVAPKPSARDPEGETLAAALRGRGYGFVEDLRAGKAFLFTVNAGDPGEALRLVAELARSTRLYNPVVHEARLLHLGEAGCDKIPRD
jgi:phosphoribosylformylglycinamidine (FGAM) synthase PurS component